MTIREQLILDILQITEQKLLLQLSNYLYQLKTEEGNTTSVLAFAGSLGSSDNDDIAESLSNEFNNIEGDW